MSYRLVPNSVTLNDLKRRNGPYFALFYRTRQVRLRKLIDTVQKIAYRIICGAARNTHSAPLLKALN